MYHCRNVKSLFHFRQVQQLRLNVCNSEEIRFSVKAFFSLNSNNYVRFFRLVKSTSYLNACILYRYFNQIRSRALQVILQSHTPGMKIVYVSEPQNFLHSCLSYSLKCCQDYFPFSGIPFSVVCVGFLCLSVNIAIVFSSNRI